MAPAKRYKVLVGSDTVYSGPWRTADVVYQAIFKTFQLVGCSIPVVLAFDL